MINLIKNEMKKIIKKKSFLILLIIATVFIGLNTYLYKKMNDSTTVSWEGTWINDYKKDIKKLDPNNENQIDEFIDLSIQIELYNLKTKYDEDSWQRYVLDNRGYDYLNNIYSAKYRTKDDNLYQTHTESLNILVKALDEDNWISFINEDKHNYEKTANRIKEELKTAFGENKKNLEEELNNTNNIIKKLDYRINENVPYNNNFLNTALEQYQFDIESYSSFEEKRINELKNDVDLKKIKHDAKVDYNTMIKDNAINKYTLDTKKDYSGGNLINSLVSNVLDQYSTFYLIILISIFGTLISQEFNKGTIKNLLLRPFTRSKILTSKYITGLLLIPILFLLFLGIQTIFGGIMFGFEGLADPILEFNFHTNEIVTYNVFVSSIINFACFLPMIILLLTLAFALSTIINNNIVAVVIPTLGLFVTSIINQIAKYYDIVVLRYFVTTNWNFKEYFLGSTSQFNGVNLTHSIIICIIYFLIMIISSYVVFKHKNIKNI